MPTITVRFFAAAREAFGARESQMNAETVDELVTTLAEAAGTQAATVLSRSSFLVNSVAATDKSVHLADGDTVDVLPPFAGG
ncbi:MoaD/ThiS family protein [Brevibacterium linens]|uniref:Molybdopterin synthase sulfur carrier subunit n=2 Tax=Brevibacterium linens TaxID=1703 RepID=A0A2H1HT09_BRELN|nr:MoaD/ThiS family protein [Brevibacterium linens]KAB1949253.1 MoaD/ThiS family protein [Brevibacterium linens ATCC 9172]SMX66041.1 Molybdopterin converting factor, small subunit [Brevibacterium linens]SMX72317.1 Molybdopterin converting factor, small subunit [Brevibacterium linens ATCC 9172]